MRGSHLCAWFLVLLMVGFYCTAADAQFLNDPYYIAGADGGQWQHSICYNPERNEYLVAYMNDPSADRSRASYWRLDGTGTKIGSEMTVTDDILDGVHDTAVAYNSVNDEFLLLYNGWEGDGTPYLHDEMRCQRIRASDGAKVGASYEIQPWTGGNFEPAIAYGSGSNVYLAVWHDGNAEGNIYAARLNGVDGALIGSIVDITASQPTLGAVPSVCYNSALDEFFVIWQQDKESIGQWWDYYGQRVRASDGALIGGNLALVTTPQWDMHGDIQWVGDLSKYILVYESNDGTTSIWGQFLNSDGSLNGSRFAICTTPYVGGVVSVGWDPSSREFLATWQDGVDTYNWGRRISETGVPIEGQFQTQGSVLYLGNWEPKPVYNSVNDEFLICWFNAYDNVWVRRYKITTVTQSPYAGVIPIPGTLQAENYDVGGESVSYHDSTSGNSGGVYRADDVDIEATSDTGGGYNVGWTSTGEWLEYTVNVAGSGDYSVKMRVATLNSNASFRVQLDGADVFGTKSFSNTGGWQTWTTIIVPTRYMAAGQHILRVCMDSGDWNFNSIEFASHGADAVSVDLDSTNVEDGITSPVGGDGDTVASTTGGHYCRRNMDPSYNDNYMYFAVADAYAYQGNYPDIYITIDYYDTGSGSLTLQYDGGSSSYTSGPAITLTNSNTWKQYTWHISDAYFGNRQNNAADFRIAGPGAGLYFYIDTVAVHRGTNVNDAQVVSDTIPTSMNAGQQYNVSVTMRNTGSTVWTQSGGYKLGAVGDSDPFADTRHLLDAGDLIEYNEQKTFSFVMTAPMTGGTYTSDWQMLKENVAWFGGIMTKQIQVIAITPPAAPTVTSPANGSTVTTVTPTIQWTGEAHDQYQVRVSLQNDSNTSTGGWDSGAVTSSGNSCVTGTLRDYSFYYVFVRLHNAGGWGSWSSAGYAFITRTNNDIGIVYTGNALPSTQGWTVYDTGSYENGSGITSTIVSDSGYNVWRLYDNSKTNRCKERFAITNVSFDTGASVAARIKATNVVGTPTYSLGISNYGVGGMFLRINMSQVQLIDINGTTRGSYSVSSGAYHKYQLTVQNSTPGNNATAVWRVYVDGTERITWTGAGLDNGFDGFMSGQAGTTAKGYWNFDYVGARADGAFPPTAWDPVY